jgi:hypothetical protein
VNHGVYLKLVKKGKYNNSHFEVRLAPEFVMLSSAFHSVIILKTFRRASQALKFGRG